MPRIDWHPVGPVDIPLKKQRDTGQKAVTGDFRQVLDEKISGLKFSRHASERLQKRSIQLSPDQIARLEQGVTKAADKGARESLVLLDDLALIVSINNRTVITAANRRELRESIFTNIDSAVLL